MYREAVLGAGPVGKGDGDATVILFDAETMTPGDDPVIPGMQAEGVEQNPLQIATMNGKLRMIVAGSAAERLLIDELAEAVEEGRVPRFDRDLRQRVLKPKRGEFLGRMRQQVDADANRPDLGNRLEYPAGNAGLLQRQSQRQAADAGADDDDLVH